MNKTDSYKKKRIRIPRVLLTAPASGVGKTMITCGILRALKNRGMKVSAFKCGPDYIDPMFHREVLGIPSYNLDLFLCGRDGVKEILLRHGGRQSENSLNGKETAQTISVLEGVMGYYDGLAGISTDASAYDVAKLTQTPAVLIVDCKGVSLSIVPLIQGFLNYGEKNGDGSQIGGVILNRISPMMYERIKTLIEQQAKVKVLGYVPVIRDFTLESRHLGLKMPGETKDLQEKLQQLAETFEKTLDLDGILALACDAKEVEPSGISDCVKNETIRIAVARDEAFCFLYEDNLELLRRLGAEIVGFSPLHDEGLPDRIAGLILPGGYPELHLKQLEDNTSMRNAVKKALESGMPCIAECGGFQYLQEGIADETGHIFSMAGALPGKSHPTGSLRRFGYITLEYGTVFGKDVGEIPAHEFHYYDSEECGSAFTAKKPLSSRKWECMISTKDLLAGYPHIHYLGNVKVAEAFLERCRFRDADPEKQRDTGQKNAEVTYRN